ncbi:MAG: TaqI-like C-terminal specificity domain-containing protein, partial [Candidatus Thorarchaeota archaeon]
SVTNSEVDFIAHGQPVDITNAVIGFLIPKSFLLRQSYLDFRNQFLSKANIIEIYDLGPNLFKQATNEVQIMIFEKKKGIDIESSIYLYPNDKIISYTDQNYDNLNVCLNISCPLCSAVQKVYVYTFESKCPYCGKPTIKLNRIRIKINKFDKKIIDKIEITGNLNFLNVKDFPKLIRGEEAKGLKEIRKLVKVKARGSCYFIYAKDDFHYYYYKTNKYFDLFELDPKMLKGENYEYYTKPKLLIKHNNIIPQASYSEDCTCFTSSIYSLLDDNAETLKFICAVLNSSIIQFYCLFAINNQQNTTINLNQYMIRHLPIKIVDDSVKSTVNRKVDSIINAFKASEGKITKKIAKLWQEIDDEIFKIYSFSEEDKNYILKSVQSEIDFINLIYSVKIK